MKAKESEEEKESSDSEGKFLSQATQKKAWKYLSTNLLSQRNITLADVTITEVSQNDIIKIEEELKDE